MNFSVLIAIGASMDSCVVFLAQNAVLYDLFFDEIVDSGFRRCAKFGTGSFGCKKSVILLFNEGRLFVVLLGSFEDVC